MAKSHAEIPHPNLLPQQRGLLKAIKKASSARALARLYQCQNATILFWLNTKKLKPGQDLMSTDKAMKIEKLVEIPGLAIEMCPSILRVKKYLETLDMDSILI